jgi:hypothetical protein
MLRSIRLTLSRARRLVLGALVALLLLAGQAGATTLSLSEFSSDFTDPHALAASLDFDVTGTTLTFTVTNLTDLANLQFGTGEYDMDAAYFNGSSDVSGLTLLSATHSVAGDVFGSWYLATSTNARRADGFGVYDFALLNDLHEPLIGPSESLVFVFSISGSGPFAAADFIQLSSIPPGHIQALGAAKFLNGPGDNSAFGATADFPEVPEPGTLSLFALGAMGLAIWRPRKI